ncbi:YxlC family protein [Paenibacillus puldeungensis]|uniref:YxlC family protein n=1 Tax=Paenibacillus puldeungensis TaxID=696536 RepID=A0ABW3RSI8_9BACL
MKHNEREWESLLINDLQRLEVLHETKVPSKEELMLKVQQMKLERQKALKRELIIFAFTAVMILACYGAIVLSLKIAFYWIQGIALILTPSLLLVMRKRRKFMDGVSEE